MQLNAIYTTLAILFFIPVDAFGQQPVEYRAFFTTAFGVDRPITDTLILHYYEDYDSTDFHVATFDLDQDGYEEFFVFDHSDCGSGGCFWTIFDAHRKRYLGSIEGGTIFIRRGKPGQYPDLDAYWKMGWQECAINQYQMFGGTYSEAGSFYLKGPQIGAFFSKLPQNAPEGQQLK